jgi:RNase H-fold protein (predicted Holliday junction resolvase)
MQDLPTQVVAFLLSQGITGVVLYLVVVTGHLDPRRLTEMANRRVDDFKTQLAKAETTASEWKQLYLQERQANEQLAEALGLERRRADSVVDKVTKAVILLEEQGPAVVRLPNEDPSGRAT